VKQRVALPTFRKGGPSLQRVRLATVFLVLSFAGLMIGAAIYHLTEQYDAAVDSAFRAARSAASAAEAHATRTLGETFRVLEGLGDIYGHSVDHGGIDDQALHDMMKKKLRHTPGVYVFAILDAARRGVASGVSYPIASERYREIPLEWLSEASDEFAFGPIYQNQSGPAAFIGHWSVPLASTVRAPDGTAAGYILALINTQYFARHYESIDVSALGRVAMWTAEGRLIAGSPNMDIDVGASAPAQPRSDLRSTSLGTRAVDQITVHIPVDGAPFSISVSLDARDFMAAWRQTRNQIAFAVAGILLTMFLFTVVLLQQLTYTQRNENALRRAKAAAEEANEAKSRFLAHMSHEFRTPLNAIMGFSEIIRNRVLGDGVSSAYTTYADHIHRSGEHLLNIVNDILDMAKIESGMQPLQHRSIDMRAAVSAAISFVQGLATQRGLRISLDIPPHLPSVSGDERFIRQVLINLLSNAIKFSPLDGEILVRATLRPGQGPGHGLDIAVKDSGPGMEPALLKRLGEPFLQGNPALSHLGKGTGLGLSICKRYMDLLGGELKIESVVGVGTTATIRFPQALLVGAPNRVP